MDAVKQKIYELTETELKAATRKEIRYMEKRQKIEEALKEIGIYTVEDLNRAIKEEKPLDLGIMTGQATAIRKAG